VLIAHINNRVHLMIKERWLLLLFSHQQCCTFGFFDIISEVIG